MHVYNYPPWATVNEQAVILRKEGKEREREREKERERLKKSERQRERGGEGGERASHLEGNKEPYCSTQEQWDVAISIFPKYGRNNL